MYYIKCVHNDECKQIERQTNPIISSSLLMYSTVFCVYVKSLRIAIAMLKYDVTKTQIDRNHESEHLNLWLFLVGIYKKKSFFFF